MRSQRWKVGAGIGLLLGVGVLGAAAVLGTQSGGGADDADRPAPSQPPSSAASAQCPTGAPSVPPVPDAPPSPSSRVTDRPPAGVTGGARWDLVFDDEFADPGVTAAKWGSGMRTGDHTIEANHELEYYLPGNSVVTTDDDGFGTIGVLRQTLQHEVVPQKMYTVRTLSGIYPPRSCATLYDPARDNTPSATNTSPTRTPYQYTSGMLNSAKSFGFRYGYVETRVKMPKGFALWPALWLRDWHPWSYEVDVLEGFDPTARTFRTSYWWGSGRSRSTESDGGDIGISAGGEPCRNVLPVPARASSTSRCSLADSVDLSSGYHTVGLSWAPSGYALYLDGAERWTSPRGAKVADSYSHLILNLAFGNNDHEFDWEHAPVKPLDPDLLRSGAFPKTSVEWDYVRVWQAHDAVDTCTPPACG